MPPPPSHQEHIDQIPSKQSASALLKTIPTEHVQHLAPFTIKEIRDSIPAHCFERSIITSGAYLLVDLLLIIALYSIAIWFDERASKFTSDFGPLASWMISIAFWNIYWFSQGAVMTGIWVIAHECGHQSFSDWKLVNNTVGWILHSALLVPYHSWRISHGVHHKGTSLMDRDQVYVPKTLSQVSKGDGDIHNVIADSPIVSLIQIFIMLTVGWPFYLATNAWGQDFGRRANHFEPSSPLFKPSHRLDVIVSNLGLIATLSLISYYSFHFSFFSVVKYYGMPYLWVNFWLILITYLQHTDVKIPHYRGEEWNFIRGALCTIDRDYGIMNSVLHHIGDTHVAHHLFSTMPHYHAQEATTAVRKILGKFYLEDKTPIMTALWRSWTTCHYVEDTGDVVYYKTFSNKKTK